MKKMIMTIALALCMCTNVYSQYMTSKDDLYGGGLYGRGFVSDEVYYGAFVNQYGLFNTAVLPRLPGHELGGDQPAPVGSGVLLMLSFGAAYAVAKKRRKD